MLRQLRIPILTAILCALAVSVSEAGHLFSNVSPVHNSPRVKQPVEHQCVISWGDQDDPIVSGSVVVVPPVSYLGTVTNSFGFSSPFQGRNAMLSGTATFEPPLGAGESVVLKFQFNTKKSFYRKQITAFVK